jgi:Alpha/beta hydrolase of unknown function (DUF900)
LQHQNNENDFVKIKLMAMGISLCLTVISIVCLPAYFINGVIAEVPLSSAKVISSSTEAISTRSYYYFTIKEGREIQNYSQGAFAYAKNLPIAQNQTMCPKQNETVIYIHGEWADEKSAIEQSNRIAMSIKANNYELYLIGFTWDSNSAISRDGWQTAKIAAERSGLELAQFILDFKTRCKDTKIRLIAHSLGASVVNSTLVTLNNNGKWNSNGFKITSIHLLGAAINNNAISRNTTLGNAIEKVVDDFYNLYDPEDNMLEYVYSHIENRDALGLLGAQHNLPLPRHYHERNVESELVPIPDADANGSLDCFDSFVLLPGDNHCGYIGYRLLHPFEYLLRDDGSMDIVVQDWSS